MKRKKSQPNSLRASSNEKSGKSPISEKKPRKRRERFAYVSPQEFESLGLTIRIITEEKKVSTSLIQRRLKIGYAAAARLLDRLEELAIVTPVRGNAERVLTGYVPTLKIKEEQPDKKPILKEATRTEKRGRPSLYSKELGAAICDRIAMGESVLQICRDDDMPEARTVYLWLLRDDKKEFLELYEKAREIQSEYFYDEMIDIADDGRNDYMERQIGEDVSITVPDHDHINRSRLRVDTRKWMLARMNPRKYGERLDLTTKGKSLKEPRPVAIQYVVPQKQ